MRYELKEIVDSEGFQCLQFRANCAIIASSVDLDRFREVVGLLVVGVTEVSGIAHVLEFRLSSIHSVEDLSSGIVSSVVAFLGLDEADSDEVFNL